MGTYIALFRQPPNRSMLLLLKLIAVVILPLSSTLIQVQLMVVEFGCSIVNQ